MCVFPACLQLVGNMATDANSAKKYWYSIRLMGRAYGHIALEVALRTHPNLVLVGEVRGRSLATGGLGALARGAPSRHCAASYVCRCCRTSPSAR